MCSDWVSVPRDSGGTDPEALSSNMLKRQQTFEVVDADVLDVKIIFEYENETCVSVRQLDGNTNQC